MQRSSFKGRPLGGVKTLLSIVMVPKAARDRQAAGSRGSRPTQRAGDYMRHAPGLAQEHGCGRLAQALAPATHRGWAAGSAAG